MSKQHNFSVGDKVLFTRIMHHLCLVGQCTNVPCPEHKPTTTHYVGKLIFRYDKSPLWTIELEDGTYDEVTQAELLFIPPGATDSQIEAMKSILT